MGQRIESAIDRVTVFPGAAWVTRVVRCAVPERTELVVAGLPAALDNDSIRVAARGPARAADARVDVEVVGEDDAAALDDGEVHDRRRALAVAEAERARLAAQRDALTSLAARTRGERDQPAPVWADAVAARLAVADARAERERALRSATAAAEQAVEDARRALTAAERRLARASRAQLPPGSIRKRVTLTVEPTGAGGEVTLDLSYLVPGARWAPGYVARLDGDGGYRLEMRAAIAQATGEDWTGAAIEVSTAAPHRWIDLPELPARRIGRAQAAPVRAGWRPPPAGVDGLFGDWDRSFADRQREPERQDAPPPPPEPEPHDAPAPPFDLDEAEMVFGDMPPAAGAPKGGGVLAGLAGLAGGRQRSKRSEGRALATKTMAASAPAMPMPQAAPSRYADDKKAVTREHQASTGEEVVDDGELVAGRDLLAYGDLRMMGPHVRGRGHLRRAARVRDPRIGQALAAAAKRARAAGRTVPPGLTCAASGVYDHAFPGDARLDVPADGSWHSVALLSRTGKLTIGHVVVPAVTADVYRVATFDNPLDAPLLPGPVDVYDGGELIVTGEIDQTAPGGAVELGLGVDPAVKVARNVRFREEVTGLLRNGLLLVHEITITAENLGKRPVHLEVRERLPAPAPDQEDIEVEVDRVAPDWEPWKPEPGSGHPPLRGGHRWQVDLEPAVKRDLHLDYHVRISGKHELAGGNRRDA